MGWYRAGEVLRRSEEELSKLEGVFRAWLVAKKGPGEKSGVINGDNGAVGNGEGPASMDG